MPVRTSSKTSSAQPAPQKASRTATKPASQATAQPSSQTNAEATTAETQPAAVTADAKALKAIRRFCVACQGGYTKDVTSCADDACPLHPYRSGEMPENCQRPPARAIRCHCLVCSDGARHEVRACAARDECALWSYRFGCAPTTWRRVKNRKTNPQPLLLPGLK